MKKRKYIFNLGSALCALIYLFVSTSLSFASNIETEELSNKASVDNFEYLDVTDSDFTGSDEVEAIERYKDENGYITSTYGYPMQSDPYVEETEILSVIGGSLDHEQEGRPYSKQDYINAGKDDFYYMSDKIFFGEWDNESEQWISEGKLDYEKYPEFETMVESVKQGDYENAKIELLQFYRQKEKELNRPKMASSDKETRISAHLTTKNFIYNGSGFEIADLMTVGTTPDWYGIDVTDKVKTYSPTRNEITFWVVATDRDGGLVEFSSRESGEKAAKLTVVVNGVTREYTPSADTYISAGSNTSSYFGFEDYLRVSESACADELYLVDADTNRTYVKFDVSDINPGDTVSGARLEFYGSNVVEGGKDKELVVFYSGDSAWDETLINYKVPSNIFSYDQQESWSWIGHGTRQVQWDPLYLQNLVDVTGWFGPLVSTYNTTGDEKYAYTGLRIFMDFLNVTGTHPAYLSTLDIAVRCSNFPQQFMQLIESEYMTPDIFTSFMKYMWIEGNEFLKFFSGGFNWGTMQKLGHYNICINFPEFKDTDVWIEDVRDRFDEVVSNSVYDDGTCVELALGYVWTTVGSTLSATELPYEQGIYDAPVPLHEKTTENLDKLTEYMMYASMPGFRDHQEGDTNTYQSSLINKFRQMYDYSKNLNLLWGATKGKEGTKPEFTSYAWLGKGKKAAMRTSWDDDALYLYTSVDGSQGTHGHADDCQVVVYAYGQYLLIDPLYGNYSGTDASSWLKSAEAHNTITVNGDSHNSEPDVDISEWETNNNYDFITMYSGNVRGAEFYERNILFVKPGFWLVNDYLVPEDKTNANSYSQTWHYLPEAAPEIDPETKITRTNFNNANIQVVPVNADALSNTVIKDGYASGGMGVITDAKYTAYEKKLKGNAVFNTVLYPENLGEECDIKTKVLEVSGMKEDQASAYDLFITNEKGVTTHYQYYQLHDNAKNVARTFGSFTTDASLLFAEFDSSGKVVSIIARDVSYVKNNETNKIVWSSDEKIEDISLKYDSNFCFIESGDISKEFLESNNIYVGAYEGKVGRVFVNGENTSFDKTLNYLYFGKKPQDEDFDNSKPSSGNNSSSSGKIHGSSSSGFATSSGSSTNDSPADVNKNGYFNDVSSEHWAKLPIEELYKYGIINGRGENIYVPDAYVTRAEFISIVIRALKKELCVYSDNFEDISGDEWYADYVETALSLGLISDDITFRPNDNITREEMAKIIVNAKELSDVIIVPDDFNIDFSDTHIINNWAKDFVSKACYIELLKGDENGNFNPKNNLTRAESAMVIYRFIAMGEKID